MSTPSPSPRRGSVARFLLAAIVAALVAVGALALLMNIFERKQEAKNPFFKVVELTDDTADPAIWGKNFPFQYDSYKRTVDMVRTRYGGSEAHPRTPTEADPRSAVAQSKIEEDPRLKKMWAGYPAYFTLQLEMRWQQVSRRARPAGQAARARSGRFSRGRAGRGA